MKKLNVLSIDWDYFIDAKADYRLLYFPDGGEFSEMLERVIWTNRYSASQANKDNIANIGVKQVEYDKICKLLETHRDKGIPGSISTSHEHIVRFLNETQSDEGKVKFNIVNLDFHHDMFDKNKNRDDCGNWVNRLDTHYKILNSYTWIRQADSPHPDKKLKSKYQETSNFDAVYNYDYDLIFICKSTLWSPPHLDKKFNKLWKSFTGEIPDSPIFKDRYDEEFKKNIKQDLEDMMLMWKLQQELDSL